MTADNTASTITVGDNGDVVVVRNGSEFDIHPDGTADAFTDKAVKMHRAHSNDSAIAPAKTTLKLGQQTADGVYAGLTADGTQQIYAMPTDLSVTLTFNNAAKAVTKLNADKNNNLGHNDWQIGSLDVMRVLQKNQNEGSLKGTFKTASSSGSNNSDWYWSSTFYTDCPPGAWNVRFSDGHVDWNSKYFFRLSCRPVRLVAAPGS